VRNVCICVCMYVSLKCQQESVACSDALKRTSWDWIYELRVYTLQSFDLLSLLMLVVLGGTINCDGRDDNQE
jgi:hypothetical protein